MFCNETEKLNNIIVKYNQYTTEPAKEPDKTDPVIQTPSPKVSNKHNLQI